MISATVGSINPKRKVMRITREPRNFQRENPYAAREPSNSTIEVVMVVIMKLFFNIVPMGAIVQTAPMFAREIWRGNINRKSVGTPGFFRASPNSARSGKSTTRAANSSTAWINSRRANLRIATPFDTVTITPPQT